MASGSVSAPGGKGPLPPQTSQDEQPWKSSQLLKAVASWVTYDDFSAMEKVMVQWWRLKKSADAATSQDPQEKLHPLLTDVSYDNDDAILAADVRRILFSSLSRYMPRANLYSHKKMKNDARLIRALCEMGASVIADYPSDNTPIKVALAEERFDLVETMVQFSNLSERIESGDTILHVLIKNYNPTLREDFNKKYLDIIGKCISKTFSKGANLNQRNKYGETPVLLAGKPYRFEILKKLIKRGADLNCRMRNGDNLLMLAFKPLVHKGIILEPDSKWIKWLVKQGIDVNCKNNDGFTPLHYASRNDVLVDLLRILVEAGADIHAVTHDGVDPLHEAAATYSVKAMRYLIERGVAFDHRDFVNGLALLYAMRYSSDKEKVKWLFKYGFDRSEKGELTLLHLAAAFGHVAIVEKSIERGANVNCQDNVYEYTPLHLASMRCEFATVPELREAGLIDGYVQDDRANVRTRATFATEHFGINLEGIHYETTILALLKAGANVHAVDNRGCTALHYAARHRDENDLIELLLRADARVDDVGLDGLLPLHHSLFSRNEKTMKYLLAFGADFNDIEHPHRNICKEIRELSPGVNSHLIKLKLAGLPNNRLYDPYFRGVTNDTAKTSSQYIDDLGELKKQMLTPTVSLLDWMRMNWRRRCVYLDDLPPNVEDKYQHYGIVVQNIREQTVRRESLMEPAKAAFQLLTAWQWPELCVERVFSFLNNRYLRNLIDASVEF